MQTYKLELPKKWRIHNVFHVSLLEQDTPLKERIDKKVSKLDAGNKNSEENKVEIIRDSAVYTRKSEGHLPGLYYLVAWKSYPKKDNI